MKIIRFTKVVTATTINTPPFAVQSWVAAFEIKDDLLMDGKI